MVYCIEGHAMSVRNLVRAGVVGGAACTWVGE